MYAVGYGATEKGRNRSDNQDAFWIDAEKGIFVVCDGMGGRAGGEIASRNAVDGLREEIHQRMKVLERFRDGDGDADAMENLAKDLVAAAGRRVYQTALEHPEYHRMGCALTLALQVRDRIVIGHVGDTRAYLLRNGTLHRLTTDHTLATELAEAGAIEPAAVQESRFIHVLTRVVGRQEFVKVDTLCMQVVPGDRLLLCSDGLSDTNPDDDIVPVLSIPDLGAVPERLIALTDEQGGDHNVTAIALEINGTPDERAAKENDLEIIFGALEAEFLFQDLYLAQLSHVVNACRFETFGAGETVMAAGTPCAQLHIVAKGRVALLREGCDSGELESGKVFGGTTLVNPRPCRATVKTLEPTTLLILTRDAVTKLIHKEPALGLAMMERLATVLAKIMDGGYLRTHGYGTGKNGENLVAPNDLF